ncbi:MAG: transporter substrate-binding domain-containing protein, partial [Verrucomicrobia bacterium]|nr:transporter substrate-binding domain-containing protein [Verrucomicrobiota bacterium]
MKRPIVSFAVVLCLFAASVIATGTGEEHLPPPNPLPPLPKKKVVVGLATGPPFNIRNPDGSWTGISVDLWRQIASELGIDFEFRETDLSGCFTGLAEGWLDVAVGPLTITE